MLYLIQSIIHNRQYSTSISSFNHSEWFLDTGASDHITGNPGNLHSLTPYHGSDGVMVGNGHTLLITHIGETTLGIGSSPIHLKDVLLVPDIKKYLLSVSKLTTDYPLIFEFDGHGFVIKDRTTNKTIVKGSKRGGFMPLIEVQQPYSPIDSSGLLEIVGTITLVMHTKGSLITCTHEISFLLL